MPVRCVNVKNIRPNPFLKFLARRALESESESASSDHNEPVWLGGTIKSLAEAIKSQGLLSPLRGRERKGHVELCFGHRRLAAVKSLGWSEVAVDLDEIDDVAMTVGSMLENLHRRDLNQLQRAESIVTAVDQLMSKEGYDQARARETVKTMLGVSDAFMSVQFLIAKEFDQVEKDLLRSGKIDVTTAVEAHRIAGTPFVTQAAQEGYSLRKVRAVDMALKQTHDPKRRSKLVKELQEEGKLPPEPQPRARRKKKTDAPPHINDIVSDAATNLKELMDYLEQNLDPEDVGSADKEVRNRFRKVVRAALKTLETYPH
jgi:ParB/RepB/Spo0J family partition protein